MLQSPVRGTVERFIEDGEGAAEEGRQALREPDPTELQVGHRRRLRADQCHQPLARRGHHMLMLPRPGHVRLDIIYNLGPRIIQRYKSCFKDMVCLAARDVCDR
jgi:hypothetical protein